MPPFSRFDSGESYYGTLFHELGHATGHPSRLNRESLTQHDLPDADDEAFGQVALEAKVGYLVTHKKQITRKFP
jgi:antirestriction protein ArdC